MKSVKDVLDSGYVLGVRRNISWYNRCSLYHFKTFDHRVFSIELKGTAFWHIYGVTYQFLEDSLKALRVSCSCQESLSNEDLISLSLKTRLVRAFIEFSVNLTEAGEGLDPMEFDLSVEMSKLLKILRIYDKSLGLKYLWRLL